MSVYAIIGGTLWGNRGAEAMVATSIGRIRDRDPDARFLVMSYSADRDAELAADDRVRVIAAGPRQVLFQAPFAVVASLLGRVGLRIPGRLLPRSLRQLRSCRALFDVSGISFHDGRLAVVAYNLLCVMPAILVGVPVVRLSQAMGPFEHPLNRWPARWVTKRSMHTFARGRITAGYLEGIGVPEERWSVAPDVAFAYRPDDSITSENAGRVADAQADVDAAVASGKRAVALVPSSLVMQKLTDEGVDYVQVLSALVDDLHDRGLHVLVMPNATREGHDGLRNNDIVVVSRLRERLEERDSATTFVDFDLNTAAIRALMGRCDLVVTSRFHAMVAGLALGIPTLVMGWSHKYEEVLEMFDCADHAIDFSVAEERLLPMVDRLLTERASVQARIRDALPGVVAAAEAQFDQLERLPG